VTDKETHSGSTKEGIKYAVTSMQGWRVHMEDAHITEPMLYAVTPATKVKLELPGHSIFAVFDGHGGSYAAFYAGRNFCRVLSQEPKFVQYAEAYINNNNSSTSADNKKTEKQLLDLLEGALINAFCDLDNEIYLALKGQKVSAADEPYNPDHDHPKKEEEKSTSAATGDSAAASVNPNAANNKKTSLEDEGDSGTTACVVVLTPEYIICANAGDSRSVLKTATKVVPLSFDHKPDDESEERRIRAAGGYVAGGRVEGDLAVSRGLGDFRFKQPSVVTQGSKAVVGAGEQKVSTIPDILVQKRNPEVDQYCIIACDGIWDVQTNEQACQMVSSIYEEGESDLGLLCEESVDIGLQLGSKDNMTALVIQLNKNMAVAKGSGVQGRRQFRQVENSKTNTSNQSPTTATDVV